MGMRHPLLEGAIVDLLLSSLMLQVENLDPFGSGGDRPLVSFLLEGAALESIVRLFLGGSVVEVANSNGVWRRRSSCQRSSMLVRASD
jgi:hypothetical protein